MLNHSGYACQMSKMIADWRSLWSAVPGTTDPVFPFGITQLAGYCSEGYTGDGCEKNGTPAYPPDLLDSSLQCQRLLLLQ